MTDMHSFLIVLIIALVTALIRFSPFIIFKNKVPKKIDYLSKVLPFSVIGMLVVYCLKDINFSKASIPALAATCITALVHKFKHNTLLSIIFGTACYMILNNFIV